MRAHAQGSSKRRAFALVVAALSAAACWGTVLPAASATAPTPTVTASLSRTGVKIAWTFAKPPKGTTAAIKIERSRDDGKVWLTVFERAKAKNRGRYNDKPGRGRMTYRVTATVRGESASATTVIQNGTSPPQPGDPWVLPPNWPAYLSPPPPAGVSPSLPPGFSECSAGHVQQLLDALNEMRQTEPLGLNQIPRPVLTIDPVLQRAARQHAINIAQVAANSSPPGRLSHDWLSSAVAASGYVGSYTENAMVDSPDPHWVVFNDFYNSPAHKSAMLSSGWRLLGAGCVYDGQRYAPDRGVLGHLWWSVLFGG